MLITQAEFARLAGVSRSAVKQAINNSLITAVVEQGGKTLISKNEGLQQYQANSRRQRKPKPAATAPAAVAHETGLELLSWGQAPAKIDPPPAQPTTAATGNTLPTDEQLLALVQSLPEDQVPDLIDSQRRKEHYLAERAKVAALREREEVGPIREMEREAFALAKSVREGMLSIIPRISADLAALGDPFEVEQLLEAEVITALRVLADG